MKHFLILLFTLISFIGITQCNQYLIYESFTSTLPTQGGTWTANSILASTSPTRTGNHAAGFNAGGATPDWIRTPQIANPGVLSFWYRRSGTTASANASWVLNIQTSTDGTTWTTRGSITAVTATYQQYSLNLGTLGLTNVFIRLIDARPSGNHERYVDDLSLTSTVSSQNTLIPFLGNCSQTLTSSLTYTITDAGGPTDTYNNNLDQTVTLTPSDNTKKLQLNFSAFNIEAVYDFLYVYDGPNTSSTLLATLNGTSLPAAITATNASGQLTLRFTSDISGLRAGFSATVTSITACTTPTTGGTISADKSLTTVNDVVTLTTSGNSGTITKLEFSYNNFTSIAGTIANPANPYAIALNVQQSNVYFRTTSKDGTCPEGLSNIVNITLKSAPAYSSGIVDDDHITNVTFSDLNNTSTNDGDAYSDYTSIIANVTKGEPYNLSVTATNTLNPGQGYAAWIDWNGDGIFQNTENVLLKPTANSTSQNLTIPSDAVTGDVLMRVLSVWNSTPNIDAYYSVGYGYGEIEEYTVRISNPISLPVELISFNATCSDEGILINWKTASEHNSSHFTLEKSRDGEDWTQIYTEQTAGNSNQLITYNFTDIKSINGLNYYRLQQYDLDGVYETFGPISVDCLTENSGYFSVFPNPSSTLFSVMLNNDLLIGDATLLIKNKLDKEVYVKSIKVEPGINLYSIDKLDLSAGVYYISIVNNNYTSGVLKQIIR
jgi:hypothetical protein